MNAMGGSSATPVPRPTAVAGSFYPAGTGALGSTVDELLRAARSTFALSADLDPSALVGVLVPHAGLVYSGVVAATAWQALLRAPGPSRGAATSSDPPSTVVLLGTNHGAGWLDGVGTWDGGPWRTPLGEVEIDRELTDAVVALGRPFAADARCHQGGSSPSRSARGPARGRSRQASGSAGSWPPGGPRARTWSSRSARTWRTTRPLVSPSG
jgi:hypothetical protein